MVACRWGVLSQYREVWSTVHWVCMMWVLCRVFQMSFCSNHVCGADYISLLSLIVLCPARVLPPGRFFLHVRDGSLKKACKA